MKLVTLMENTPSKHRGLYTEHGLSFYLETPHTHLLFDFGESGRVMENARKLNIPLDTIDRAVCSHAHYDHAAGLRECLPQLHLHTLVTGQGFWNAKYSTDGHCYSYLGPGYGQELLEQYHMAQQECGQLLQLSEDCWAVGQFNHPNDWEAAPARFVLETAPETFVPDRFADEICLAVETGEGLAVIVGCSHPGVINMVKTVAERLQRPVVSVWGGAHLVEADEQRILHTAQELQEMGVKRVGLCHCSGNQLDSIAQNIPNVECVRLGTGDTVFL